MSLNALFVGFLSSIFGARLLSVLIYYPQYLSNPLEIFKTWRGGLVYYGGFLGGTCGCIIYFFWKRISPWPFGDAIAPAIGIGLFLTRIGCFLNGDDFGIPSSLPWAVQFPAGSIPYRAHLNSGLIQSRELYSLPVHPVQLYESFLGLILFIWLTRRFASRKYAGEIFGKLTLSYAIGRFLLEFFRGDIERGFLGSLSTSQTISLILIPITTVFLYLQQKANRILNSNNL